MIRNHKKALAWLIVLASALVGGAQAQNVQAPRATLVQVDVIAEGTEIILTDPFGWRVAGYGVVRESFLEILMDDDDDARRVIVLVASPRGDLWTETASFVDGDFVISDPTGVLTLTQWFAARGVQLTYAYTDDDDDRSTPNRRSSDEDHEDGIDDVDDEESEGGEDDVERDDDDDEYDEEDEEEEQDEEDEREDEEEDDGDDDRDDDA